MYKCALLITVEKLLLPNNVRWEPLGSKLKALDSTLLSGWAALCYAHCSDLHVGMGSCLGCHSTVLRGAARSHCTRTPALQTNGAAAEDMKKNAR